MSDVAVHARRVGRYGWRPSLPDQRDMIADTAGITILDEVDPRRDMPAVYDQGQLGSCTANAVSAAVQYDRMLDADADVAAPSRLFVYYCERMYEGVLGQGDTGAMGHDGFRAFRHLGAPDEGQWPYEIATFQADPPSEVWQAANLLRLEKHYRLVGQSQAAVKACLSNRQTVAFGFTVYESFEGEEVARTGVVPLPALSEQVVGGHEVLAVGYLRDDPEHVLCRNSWGVGWGEGGYFRFPWDYLLSSDLADDLRTIVRPL